MPSCPICEVPLETARQREGVYYPCHGCNGRAVTVSQVRHVLGEKVATKLLRLLKLSRSPSQRKCPFCGELMLAVSSQDPELELDACRACNAVWFDAPTYESLPELAFESTSMLPMQTTEIIAMERLRELKERQEAERKQARKKKPLRRIFEDGKSSEPPG
jgi:Zn-finger nucleic acid-binding protein